MARSFVLWLHGLDDSGPANEHIKALFTSSEFRNTDWSFPSAPSIPVTCNNGAITPSWFDIHEIPVTTDSTKDENGVVKAVKHVHAILDKELAAGTNPNNVFVCGESQGGALTLASVLLYPRTLGGGAVFSGWVPFNSSIIEQIPPEAKKTPILWLHGIADRTVLFETGQAGQHFLEQAGVSCEFKQQGVAGPRVMDHHSSSEVFVVVKYNGIAICAWCLYSYLIITYKKDGKRMELDMVCSPNPFKICKWGF